MNEKPISTVPLWYKLTCIGATVWNLFGVLAFFGQIMMTEEMINELPADQQDLYRNLPMWVNVIFAVAVFAGTAGSIALLLRQSWSIPVLGISFVAVVIQMIYNCFLSNAIQVQGAVAAIFAVVIVVIALALLLLSIFARQKLWLSTRFK